MGRFEKTPYIGTNHIIVDERVGQTIKHVHFAHAFWPRHWAWYMLLGFVVGLGVGHVTGTVVQLYLPEGEVAAGLRKALQDA